MSESVRESTPESPSPRTEQPAGLRPKGPFTAPRATPPAPATEQQGGETTANTPHDDVLLDTECEVIAIGHAKFYLRYADWLPPLAEDEFDGLTASIREHGIQQPVVVYRLLNNHFDVIDGLHRLKVAQALALDLAQIPLNILDQATSVKEQKALAWSLNADRRHLTKEQRQARALELRKQGLSYRAIGEQLGVSQMTARSDVQEAGVKNFTPEIADQDEGAEEPPARIVGKDGKAYRATVPAPSENEIQIAREFIVDALRKKYSPLARGQLYRDASRIAGASGIKRKAFDAALDAMIEAGSVKEHVNPHGAREYHFADIVDRLEQRAADSEKTGAFSHIPKWEPSWSPVPPAESPDSDDELSSFLNASVSYITSVIKSRGARQSRAELDRLLELERGREKPRKTLVDFLTFYRTPDRLPSESEQESPTVVDELHATFDHDAITLTGRSDDGAWHRAIEIARKLVAANVWNGSDRIEFDAYALHDRLFGVSRVEPSDLVEGDDYQFAKPAATPEPEHAAEYAYLRFAAAARAILDSLPTIRAAEEVAWADLADARRQEARELLDALSAAATDLPILLSEINQKLGAA